MAEIDEKARTVRHAVARAINPVGFDNDGWPRWSDCVASNTLISETLSQADAAILAYDAAKAAPGEAVAWRAVAHPKTRMGTMVDQIEWMLIERADSLYGKGCWDLQPLYASPAPPPDATAAGGVDAVARRAKYLLNRMENDDGLGIGEIDTMLRMVIALASPAPSETGGVSAPASGGEDE